VGGREGHVAWGFKYSREVQPIAVVLSRDRAELRAGAGKNAGEPRSTGSVINSVIRLNHLCRINVISRRRRDIAGRAAFRLIPLALTSTTARTLLRSLSVLSGDVNASCRCNRRQRWRN